MAEQGDDEKHHRRNGDRVPADPTANVIAILDAAVQRQDDLRIQESRHVREVADLRAEHDANLRVAETARINAIRAVDVSAVAAAAAVSATQATTLAAQVATSADTLRNQVAAAATASTVALAAALDPIQKDIAELRRAQYEGVGAKTQVVETQAATGGSRQYIGLWIAAVALAATLILGFAGVAITLILKGGP